MLRGKYYRFTLQLPTRGHYVATWLETVESTYNYSPSEIFPPRVVIMIFKECAISIKINIELINE